MKYCRSCGASMNDDASFCPNCGEGVNGEAVQVKNEQFTNYSEIKERNLALAIILTIITCGLYGIYWQVKVNDEALELSDEKGPSGIVVILLSILTCSIYSLFWAYKMGVCTDKMKNTPNGNTGLLYIILTLFGFGIVNMALTQDAINNKVNGR